jgi:hypothetical protein
MLTVDMKRRATIAEIKAHPWCKEAFAHIEVNHIERTRVTSKDQIDSDILVQLERAGFPQEQVIKDLLSNESTKQTFVYYFLALDMKKRIKQKEEAELRKIALKRTLSKEKKAADQMDKAKDTSAQHRSWSPEDSAKLRESLVKEQQEAQRPSTPTMNSKKKSLLNLFPLKKSNSAQPPKDKKKLLRTVSGHFNSESTSTRTAEELAVDLRKILTDLQLSFKENEFIFTVKDPKTKFKIELCQIKKLESLRGIKFSRANGSSFDYKKICDAIKAQLKL